MYWVATRGAPPPNHTSSAFSTLRSSGGSSVSGGMRLTSAIALVVAAAGMALGVVSRARRARAGARTGQDEELLRQYEEHDVAPSRAVYVL